VRRVTLNFLAAHVSVSESFLETITHHQLDGLAGTFILSFIKHDISITSLEYGNAVHIQSTPTPTHAVKTRAKVLITAQPDGD